jgi:hypothetical protein
MLGTGGISAKRKWFPLLLSGFFLRFLLFFVFHRAHPLSHNLANKTKYPLLCVKPFRRSFSGKELTPHLKFQYLCNTLAV